MPRTSSEWVVSDLSTVGPASLAANGDVQGNRARIAETGIKKDEATSIQSTARQIVPQTHVFELDRRKSIEARPSTTTRSRRQSNATLRPLDIGAAAAEGSSSAAALPLCRSPTASTKGARPAEEARHARRLSMRGPWFCSPLTLLTTAMAAICLFVIVSSFITRQKDIKGCRMSYMRPSFVQLSDFDTEHTRFASKYSLYLYREGGVDLDTKVKGVPVLFIPGNAGSYKQVRPIAAEAATYYHDQLRGDAAAIGTGTRNLDFFTVDFNEDITAFHGQTLLDQAEYLNEAVAYILSLYHNPRQSSRDPNLPDPTSVILLGHSMGGVVARTMLVMPNYQSNSINTIITMSAPHARPPVSFDAEIVSTYKKINNYWRRAYSQQWANNNPLWHVTLISIAGGGLDSVVPSDYASLESLVPDTHGFTVFTSTVPTVWTSMDHQAILWCDQFRKVLVKSLYDVVDANRPGQTKPRADRMRIFKRWFLTGMESIIEKTIAQNDPTTLLTLEDESHTVLAQGERLALRGLGMSQTAKAYLLPVPPQGTPDKKRFTLLTDQVLHRSGNPGKIDVLFCSLFPLHGQSAALFSMDLELFGDHAGPTKLACKTAAPDVIQLPASTRDLKLPFYLGGEKPIVPFSYLQYELEDVSDYQFVAVIDKKTTPGPGWVVGEFSDNAQSQHVSPVSLQRLVALGVTWNLPADRPMVSELKIPALHSSLLAYKLSISQEACAEKRELFAPLLRQHIADPYESKYFVNVNQVDVSLHGVSPFMPPALRYRGAHEGASLQFWTDTTCNSSMEVKVRVDMLGSLGKLYMRYRTVFAAFPLLVVALVLRKQFRLYDETGLFIPFSESLDLCLRQSLPLMLLSLTCLSLSLSQLNITSPASSSPGLWETHGNASEGIIDFTRNDLLDGSQDPFFWFMVPLIGAICVGVCVAINYAALVLVYVISLSYGCFNFKTFWNRAGEKRGALSPVFAPSTPARRILTTTLLLGLVVTVIPYQFAYLVACLVQIATCARAMRFARDAPSNTNHNFYNYAHSVLILMLWILPINLPILVVWVHNLAVHWLTPFSSHHNVLSIMPFILLVETLTTGKMVPRITSRLRHFTSVLFFGIAVYAAVYGVTYAYVLHSLVNFATAWLVAIHFSTSDWKLIRTSTLLEPREFEPAIKSDKRP